MKKTPPFIAAFLAISMTGCTLSGASKKPVTPAPVVAKPAPAPAPAPPPPPLSTPQTQVELPRPQLIDPAAVAVDAPPQPQTEPAEAPPARPPAGRRPTGAGTQSAPANAPAATPPTATPPANTTPPAEPATPQIQEIVPAAEAKRLQEQAQARRRDVQQMLDQLGRRQLNTAQRGVITSINSFLASSVDAERRGDMKLADALADRAQILAKDLINGK